MLKKAKGGHFFNTDYSLIFSYKMLYHGEPFLEIGAAFMDLPFASIRLKRGGQEFFADFFFNSKGVIFAVMFSKFPADDQFEAARAGSRNSCSPSEQGQGAHSERRSRGSSWHGTLILSLTLHSSRRGGNHPSAQRWIEG